MSREQRVNQKVCFIAGAGHSGSTLLGLILGSHHECFYGGEVKKISLSKGGVPREKGVCRRCGPECAIWNGLSELDAPDLYEALSLRTRKPVIIDSAKNTEWIREQVSHLFRTSATPFLIFLQRDGRAVINSRIRKYPSIAVETLIRDWMEQIASTNELFDAFAGKKIKLHYEALATEPEASVERLCDFLEIPFEREILDYYQHEHHAIAGNIGTQFLVAKAQAVETPYVRLSARNEYYYANHPLGIHLDLRWKEELSPSARAIFEEIAAPLNADLSWEG
ncbi:MAG: sulfotransferase [Ardenticatenales bacterium]|nr:sulfotransferase [Ardenticatenales bacterium]